MMGYEYILFDLDGTLTDSRIGIENSILYALKKYDISIADRSILNKFLGPPLWESFQKYCNFSKEEADKAVEYYREYYNDKGIYENILYDGIEDLLKVLKENGKTLIVATSKPEVYAKQILKHFELEKYFDYIAGSNLDGSRSNKAEVIKYALESLNILDKLKAIMIGDSEHDIIGAKKNGIHSIGVLFGYGGSEELEKAGRDYMVECILEIERILISD